LSCGAKVWIETHSPIETDSPTTNWENQLCLSPA
jgi:hypothetical protein